MSGGFNKRYQGKKSVNPRDKKRKDIEKSLTHGANIKRKYFKLLEKEGEVVPEKKKSKKEKISLRGSENEGYDHEKDSADADEDAEFKNPMMTYAERAQLIKERKQEKRKESIERVKTQRKQIDDEKAKRAKIKKRLERKNKYGQPKMAPRINNLLDKIKKDMD